MSRAAPTMKTEAVSPSPVFDKCYRYRDAERARQVRLYPFFRALDSGSDPEVTIEGLRMIMLGSNNYLGLANDPRVKEAAVAAVRKYGSSCAGSRLLNGTLDLHVRLEERLAEFMRQPAAVTFTTGYQVNLGTLSCLVGKGDTVYLDKLDHACIIDGARLSFGHVCRFKHSDPVDLTRQLKNDDGAGGRLVAARAALAIMEREPEGRVVLWETARCFADALKSMGLDGGKPERRVVASGVGDVLVAIMMVHGLPGGGVSGNCVLPPATPPG